MRYDLNLLPVFVALMEQPVPDTSHGYCETCLSTYYRLEYCAPP